MLTTLVTFTGTANGENPMCGLSADTAGNLYGATTLGGPQGMGTAFEVAAGTAAQTTLAAFNGSSGGNLGGTPIVDAAGNLFGTTRYGGGYGSVFEVVAGTRTPTTVATFTGRNGSNPVAGVTADAAGDLFGTAAGSVSGTYGTVFEVAAGAHALTIVTTFTGASNGGLYPLGGLAIDAAGDLFGTTQFGGPTEDGTVFEVAAGTRTATTLFAFAGTNGQAPESTLLLDAAGNLYGTTTSGGPANFGTVFEIAAGTHALSTLASFSGVNGANPVAGLTADAAGNLYGTTTYGGAGHGTVFEVPAGGGTVTTLTAFTGANGATPFSGLVADAFGNLYGTTRSGGSADDGTVFELTSTGFVVPEPAAAAVLAVAGVGRLGRRRRTSRDGG